MDACKAQIHDEKVKALAKCNILPETVGLSLYRKKELLTVTCKICSQYVLDMNMYDSSPASCLAIWRPFFRSL